jgi:hypothetical protein
MTAAADTSAAEPQADAWEAAQAQARVVVERQLQVLGRLAEIGLAIATALEQQVTAEGAKGETALAYARVSRAVRLTVALQSSVLQDLQALDRAAGSRQVRTALQGRARPAAARPRAPGARRTRARPGDRGRGRQRGRGRAPGRRGL